MKAEEKNGCGHAATLLEAFGFEASYQLPQEAFDIELGDYCEIEEYLGWEIQSEPTFAVIHRRTGYTWVALFDEIENVERVKLLIRKGFEADCWNAMGCGDES